MKEYKSSVFTLLKHVVYSVAAGFVLCIIIMCFSNNPFICYGISFLVTLYLLYSTLHDDNIKITLDNDIMQVYRFRKLLHTFKLKKLVVKTYVKTTIDSSGSDSDCTLIIINPETDEQVTLDCSMLGLDNFEKLKADLNVVNESEPVKVITTVKTKN